MLVGRLVGREREEGPHRGGPATITVTASLVGVYVSRVRKLYLAEGSPRDATEHGSPTRRPWSTSGCTAHKTLPGRTGSRRCLLTASTQHPRRPQLLLNPEFLPDEVCGPPTLASQVRDPDWDK